MTAVARHRLEWRLQRPRMHRPERQLRAQDELARHHLDGQVRVLMLDFDVVVHGGSAIANRRDKTGRSAGRRDG